MDSIDEVIKYTNKFDEYLNGCENTTDWLNSLSMTQLSKYKVGVIDIINNLQIDYKQNLHKEIVVISIGLYMAELGVDELPKSDNFINQIVMKFCYNVVIYYLAQYNKVIITNDFFVYKFEKKLFKVNSVYRSILENHIKCINYEKNDNEDIYSVDDLNFGSFL